MMRKSAACLLLGDLEKVRKQTDVRKTNSVVTLSLSLLLLPLLLLFLLFLLFVCFSRCTLLSERERDREKERDRERERQRENTPPQN